MLLPQVISNDLKFEILKLMGSWQTNESKENPLNGYNLVIHIF